ncbi:MAG TPA: SAM-dependent methyltransferase [Nitrosopumilaceae archaeon]|nr:SAM-dependent methyltransferase [Nitrosopumilaceae archaeon]
MKIEEYLDSLPQNLVSGDDVQLSEKSFREIFNFIDLGKNDVFYHLGCGDGLGVKIAIEEFNIRKGIGIDNNCQKIDQAKNFSGEYLCEDIKNSNFSDATVILFWFTDEEIIKRMIEKFENLKHETKIITIWGPLPDCLPQKVNFPYIINTVPFKKTSSLQEQLLAVFGVKCVDFVTAWEFAERYTKAIGDPKVKNDRFLTIIQTLVIWINAKNLGVACREEIPESIKTYLNIMKMHFDIDFEHLLKY